MSVKTEPYLSVKTVGTLTDADAPSLGWQRPTVPATVLREMATEHDPEIGERVQALRKQKGWSWETLGYKAGVSAKTVERLEKHQVEARRNTIEKIADALAVDVYALLGEPTTPTGVPLSAQVDDVAGEFRGLVQQIFDRDDQHRARMYERLDRLTVMVEALLAAHGVSVPDDDAGRTDRTIEESLGALAEMAREPEAPPSEGLPAGADRRSRVRRRAER